MHSGIVHSSIIVHSGSSGQRLVALGRPGPKGSAHKWPSLGCSLLPALPAFADPTIQMKRQNTDKIQIQIHTTGQAPAAHYLVHRQLFRPDHSIPCSRLPQTPSFCSLLSSDTPDTSSFHPTPQLFSQLTLDIAEST